MWETKYEIFRFSSIELTNKEQLVPFTEKLFCVRSMAVVQAYFEEKGFQDKSSSYAWGFVAAKIRDKVWLDKSLRKKEYFVCSTDYSRVQELSLQLLHQLPRKQKTIFEKQTSLFSFSFLYTSPVVLLWSPVERKCHESWPWPSSVTTYAGGLDFK